MPVKVFCGSVSRTAALLQRRQHLTMLVPAQCGSFWERTLSCHGMRRWPDRSHGTEAMSRSGLRIIAVTGMISAARVQASAAAGALLAIRRIDSKDGCIPP